MTARHFQSESPIRSFVVPSLPHSLAGDPDTTFAFLMIQGLPSNAYLNIFHADPRMQRKASRANCPGTRLPDEPLFISSQSEDFSTMKIVLKDINSPLLAYHILWIESLKKLTSAVSTEFLQANAHTPLFPRRASPREGVGRESYSVFSTT